VASLKIPLQIICPNCQQGNLPGSPYCSGCGAPLSEVPPGIASTSRPDVYANEAEAIGRFLNEGQDKGLVKQSYERAIAILTTGESIEYIAVAGRMNLAHPPDCVVATSKRIILLRKKVLGKYEIDDCYWRDVRSATLKDVKNAVSLSLEAIQGWHITIESLPKAQAWRIYEIALQNSQRLRESTVERPAGSGSAFGANAVASWPAFQAGSSSSLGGVLGSAMHAANNAYEAHLAATPAPLAVPLPIRPESATPAAASGTGGLGQPGTTGRFDAQGGLESEKPAGPAPAPGFVPTPESVLQNILQQSQGVSDGTPTRPIQFAAAAFQSPSTTDVQPVTMRETITDPHLRPTPPMPTLEQIAVFSGPLTFNHLSSKEISAPLEHYSLPPDSRASSGQLSQWPVSGSLSADSANDGESWHSQLRQVQDIAEVDKVFANGVDDTSLTGARQNNKKGAAKEDKNKPAQLPDDLDTPVDLTDAIGYMLPTSPNLASGPLPLPGSLTSGPLLPAAPSSSNETELFSQTSDIDNENLSTQLLYFDPALESDADRPTDINLGQYVTETSQASRNGKKSTAPTGAKSTSGRSSGAGPSSRSSQPKSGADDPISKMKQLKMLLDAGFINEADYEAKKADILARFF
jgi:hypothetical protein